MVFIPDYRNLVAAVRNQRPARLPYYEHIISPKIMEQILGTPFADLEKKPDSASQHEFFKHYCRFWQSMGYDTVSYEYCVTNVIPNSGAIMGGHPGPITDRASFEAFPWKELPGRYWDKCAVRFDALRAALPKGMKVVGGVGNGTFEISEDLVGYEYLCLMMADEPELVVDLFKRIGDLQVTLWQEMVRRNSDIYCVWRFGDDLGFKTGTLLSPDFIRQNIIPQYRRVLAIVRPSPHPFLLHSCGSIFSVMDDLIATGISAKHSNEDQIAPFDDWISKYGCKIGLMGGIDVDILCRETPDQVENIVYERAKRFRQNAKGYALGSGNSIPNYIPIEGYRAMLRAGERIRAEEG